MNLRCCFVPRQLLFLFVTALLISRWPAHGQETITLRSGQTQAVTILGVGDGGIKVQIGDAQMVEPFSNLTAVTMSPPPEFAAAAAAYGQGDLQGALGIANSLVQSYRGLPTDWARQAMLMVGDIDVSLGQLPQAQAAYKDYQAAYPGGDATALNIGLASIDVANKDLDSAKAKLAPVLNNALATRNPPASTGALIGRAYLVSGEIKEQSGDFPGALEDYLRTVTIFPQDRTAAAGAQQRADALRRSHGVAVP
jgi:tetratricopeptide (TPR) repeat protein